MSARILIGAQWGDEGKGKWCDLFAKDAYGIARFQGGNNAGHTLYIEGKKLVLHQIPSGIFQKNKKIALGSQVVINPSELLKEIEGIKNQISFNSENFFISKKAHLITPWHIHLDGLREKSSTKPIGTTKRGIGPTYSEKTNRLGLRTEIFVDESSYSEWLLQMKESTSGFKIFYEDNKKLWEEFESCAKALQPLVKETESIIRKDLKEGKVWLLEGAQGTLLDIDHGTYPYVTSSQTIAAGAIASIGFKPGYVEKIYGIAKAYVTRVGEGPFPTELNDDMGELMGKKGHEFGATTNRKRKCGWFDGVAMKYAVEVNGFDALILNKMDILADFPEVKIATSYTHPTLGILKEFPSSAKILGECSPNYETFKGWKSIEGSTLPKEALIFINFIEEFCQVPVAYVGIGPGREDYLEI